MEQPANNLTAMFPGPLDLRVLNGGRRQVITPFRCVGPKISFTVQAAFICDLASIPRILHVVLPKIGNHDKAAVGHDWLYRYQTCTRKEADQFFLAGMKDQGVSWWRRRAMYAGVRIGGWVTWNKHKELSK